MPNYVNDSLIDSNQPQYQELVKFLLTPLLDSPDNLRVDCESTNQNQRVWIRLALEKEEQGKVFGRGGRNLRAVRTILKTAAEAAQQSVYLDVYGEQKSRSDESQNGRNTERSEFSPKGKKEDNQGSKKRKPQKRSKPNLKRSSDRVSPKNS
ncbi:KH domain-containing protein [Euhalothece natronophila Z-M001]|uniref:KH domain-containing protein n=1 Tax=Euhalothece natronophila Z-M001 TaxID=522448 RepID=A0A5B8NN83_9CHRO|nr:KH domain-containing protein [Euhalothece natronophila]QDZ40427.1 KH domain-containing protein [Euhalothece natronophila Z-M001]